MIKFLILILILFNLTHARNTCSKKLFSVTINNAIIKDILENLADNCNFSIIPEDEITIKQLNKKLFYTKLKNSSLKEFLKLLLGDNNLFYYFNRNKLKISFVKTKTFYFDYVSGERISSSNVSTDIESNGGSSSGDSSGVQIKNNGSITLWKEIQKNLKILVQQTSNSYKDTKIIVNQESGIITISGTKRQLQIAELYLDKLKTRLTTQVLIDVKILIVDFSFNSTTGVDWSKIHKFQNFATSLKNTKSLDAKTSLLTFDHSISVDNIVKFLKSQGDVKSVSNPKLLALNNHTAFMNVGKEIFYKLRTTSNTQNSVSNSSTSGEKIKSVFAGVLLNITPQISNNGSIILKINPSITGVVGDISKERDIPPDLEKKQLSSVVKVQDKEHIVIGGLISTTNKTTVQKVPLLGDLPFLDNLFKYKEDIQSNNELVIIITPQIIKPKTNISLESLGYRKLKYDK